MSMRLPRRLLANPWLRRLLANLWLRPLLASLLVAVVLLAMTGASVWIARALEGHGRAGKPFDGLGWYLVRVTLVILPIFYAALRLDVLGRIRRLRLKLFAALLVGQIAALIAAVVITHDPRAMTLEPPADGLFAILLVYAAVLSLALFYLLANSMTASLAHIRAGAARIAEGDFETRVAVDGRDELASLAADLNAMAARLAAVAGQERRMERSRRELIAAVSHDLRTPLAAIRATIEAITDGVVTDEETIARYLRTMHTGTKELSRLIDDLFELSRIDAGALTLAPEPASMADLISDTLERMRPQAEARGVALRGAVEDGLPLVPLDARHLGRVLVNLVDNALRHTPAGGCVDLSARCEGDVVRIAVADTGEGIAPADLPYVFERFYRGEKSRSREHGGAGLGLAISKGIVEAHGGSIRAESMHPHGTCIIFTLPLAPDMYHRDNESHPRVAAATGRA